MPVMHCYPFLPVFAAGRKARDEHAKTTTAGLGASEAPGSNRSPELLEWRHLGVATLVFLSLSASARRAAEASTEHRPGAGTPACTRRQALAWRDVWGGWRRIGSRDGAVRRATESHRHRPAACLGSPPTAVSPPLAHQRRLPGHRRRCGSCLQRGQAGLQSHRCRS